MNERIRELSAIAKNLTTDEAIHLSRIHNRTLSLDELGEIHNQKFAELIVRECMELASKEQKRYASITHRNMSECAVALGNFSLLIEDHFGDEE